MKSPDEDFIKYFFKELCPDNHFTGQLKEDFFGYTLRGIKEFITEEMKHLLDDAVNPPELKTENDNDRGLKEENQTEFTEDEREGHYIIRAIASSVVSPSRITYKDTASYCNVLLDNNSWKPIVRLHFNNSKKKKLEIFSIDDRGSRFSTLFPIDDINEIYNYAEKFKSIVISYEEGKAIKSQP